MKITMLGTGNALVTECYNTCFVIEDGGKLFMVDGGGGNAVLQQLKKAGINWKNIHQIFVTHKHVDHILGIVWMIRMICQNMAAGKYEGEAYIYAHDEVIGILRDMAEKLLVPKQTSFIGDRLHLITVSDGEELNIIGHRVKAFDIHSTKAKQFGFTMYYGEGQKLTCCGDEPYCEYEHDYAAGSDWLLHEAFCLYGERDEFRPYEKNHSTVKDAAELGEALGVKNLLLYHSEDKNILCRKLLYTAEGEQYFSGRIFVPDDLETIEI